MLALAGTGYGLIGLLVIGSGLLGAGSLTALAFALFIGLAADA